MELRLTCLMFNSIVVMLMSYGMFCFLKATDWISWSYPVNPINSSCMLLSSCMHGMVIGACWACQQSWEAAAAKSSLLLNPMVIPSSPAFSSDMANCEHSFNWISDDAMMSVACDFGWPPHEMQTGLASYCMNCFAVGCLDCA